MTVNRMSSFCEISDMAKSKDQMLELDARMKLEYVLRDRPKDHELVLAYLHNIPKEKASQYFQQINMHTENEEGLKLCVEAMVKDARSKMEEDGYATSSINESKSLFLNALLQIGFSAASNGLQYFMGGIDGQQVFRNVCRDTRSKVVPSVIADGARIALTPHVGHDVAAFSGTLISAGVSQSLEHVNWQEFRAGEQEECEDMEELIPLPPPGEEGCEDRQQQIPFSSSTEENSFQILNVEEKASPIPLPPPEWQRGNNSDEAGPN